MNAGASVLPASLSEPDAIRVLLIEDGVIDRGFLADQLSKQGFAVATVASLSDAPDAARDADVIVLHCDWAKMSSIDLVAKLHRLGLKVPVVLLTDEASPAHECLALDKGAVDVIGKSRGSEVLAKRLKGVVRTFGRTDQPRPDRSMICGKLLLRPDVSRAYWKDVGAGLPLGGQFLDGLAEPIGQARTCARLLWHRGYRGRGATRSRASTLQYWPQARPADPRRWSRRMSPSRFGYRSRSKQ